MRFGYSKEKGVAGLTIFLSMITMLFVIGLLIMIFALMGGEVETSATKDTTVTVVDETVSTVDEAGVGLTYFGHRAAVCTVSSCTNVTGTIPTTNYTTTACKIAFTIGDDFNATDWVCNYTATYNADTTASKVINATSDSLSEAVDWFDLFIVIGAMVVLILLTVIIITAIRGSGLIAGETGAGAGSGNIGTA